MTTNNWQLLRQYEKLADDGLVPTLAHRCGTEYTTLLGNDDDPAFLCYMCNTTVYFGIARWDELQQAVEDNDLCGP